MIRSLFDKVARLGRRFHREDEAVAAVEFALIVPFLMTLYFGSIEGAALFTVDRRVNSISATVGDLVSQWDTDDGVIPVATVNDYLAASTGIMAPYSTTGLKIVVTMVKVKANGTTEVLWSKPNSAGTAKVKGTSYSDLVTTSMMDQVSRGGCVIAAEVTYSYLPILGQFFKAAFNLKHTNYFLPRFGSTKVIDISTSSPALAAAACTAT